MKNILRRTLSVILAVCVIVVFSVFALPGATSSAASKKKVTLSKKATSICVNKNRVIKVKNANKKVRWSSTNRKIARVRKASGKWRATAVIKAGRKTGTCWIKAKVGKKVLRCKVRVYKRSNGIYPGEEDRKIETIPLSDSAKNLIKQFGLESAGAPSTQTSEAFNNAVANFSVDLLKRTIAQDTANNIRGNTLVSPDSVLTALAMLENGANGQTLTQMEDTFAPGMSAQEFNANLSAMNKRLSKNGKPIYTVANSIWSREGLMSVSRDFLQTNLNYHNAEFYEAPFDGQTVNDMNHWVYNNTRNMINRIIDNLSTEDRMVLINAISFEGNWVEPFVNIDNNGEFTKEDGQTQTVKMMRSTDYYRYLQLNGGKGFAKPYVCNKTGGAISFVGLLPPEGMDVDTYLNSLTGTSFVEAWKASARKEDQAPVRVDVKLPKFSYDYGTSMEGILSDMGMPDAFTGAADFSRLIAPDSPTQSIMVDRVLHKTHIELDEKGTKAAAVTAVIAKAGAIIHEAPPVEVHLTRPFVYALVDEQTGIPLFIGVVRSI